MFFIATGLLGCSITFLLFLRYCLPLPIPFSYKLSVMIACVIIGCIPIFVRIPFRGMFFNFYYYGLYFLYISAVILLSLTILRDLIWSLAYYINSNICANPPFHYSETLVKANITTVILAIIISFYALYEGLKTPGIKYVQIYSSKIQHEEKILLLSDIHLNKVTYLKKLQSIVDAVNSEDPDVILLAGDIIDDDVSNIKDSLEVLSKLKAKNGIYFVTGNHEFYAGYRASTAALKSCGFVLLENSGVSVNEQLYIGGVPDVFSIAFHNTLVPNITKTFLESHKDQFLILVSHTPWDLGKNNNFDLEVSGHTHGGQIFPFHIFAYLYNPYFTGLYDMKNDSKIYVSRGCGEWGPQMRLFSPSEITVIRLAGENKN